MLFRFFVRGKEMAYWERGRSLFGEFIDRGCGFLYVTDNDVFVIDILNIENLKSIYHTLYTIHNKECKGRNAYWISAWDNSRHL